MGISGRLLYGVTDLLLSPIFQSCKDLLAHQARWKVVGSPWISSEGSILRRRIRRELQVERLGSWVNDAPLQPSRYKFGIKNAS
jgi:hypothetical protein